VWVHGGTNAERQFAIGVLAGRGIEARFDDRAEDVPLQIIVGYGEHGRRPTPAQKQAAIPESCGTERIDWSIDTSSISSVHRLDVRLYFVENKGGTPGSSIKIVSDEPETIEAAQINITNILRWHEQHQKFVKSRDIYDSGTVFRTLEINRVAPRTQTPIEKAEDVPCDKNLCDRNPPKRHAAPGRPRRRHLSIESGPSRGVERALDAGTAPENDRFRIVRARVNDTNAVRRDAAPRQSRDLRRRKRVLADEREGNRKPTGRD
jgi:hypothetical protein